MCVCVYVYTVEVNKIIYIIYTFVYIYYVYILLYIYRACKIQIMYIINVYIVIYTVEVKSLHTPCRICKMLIILLSKRDHTNACYCLFSTDLNKIFHIKYVFM